MNACHRAASLRRALPLIVCAITAFSVAPATAQTDTITKTIIGTGGHTTFTFHDAKKRFAVTTLNLAPNDITVNGPSGVMSDGVFTITGDSYGTYFVKVSYTCADPNCTEAGTTVVKVVVRPPSMPEEEEYVDDGPDSYLLELDSMMFVWDNDGLYSVGDLGGGRRLYLPMYSPPNCLDIIDAWVMETPDGPVIQFELSDSTIHEARMVNKIGLDAQQIGVDPDRSGQHVFWRGIEALMLVTSQGIYERSDSTQAWKRDSAGLGSIPVFDAANDDSERVWITTSKGLYSKGLTDNYWKHNDALGLGGLKALHIDNLDRIFVSGSDDTVRYSTDDGRSWKVNFNGLPNTPFLKFGSDSAHNIYGISEYGDHLYRSLGGTQPWTEIGHGIIGRVAPSSPVYSAFNSVQGNSTLYAGTKYGVYASTDFGTTWSESNAGLHTTTMTALGLSRDHRPVVSDNRGIIHRPAGDSAWTKLYPPGDTVAARMTLYNDDLGDLFTQQPVPSYSVIPATVISSDNGRTWTPDSAPGGPLSSGVFFVDERGVQHAATYGSDSANPGMIYSRMAGQPWSADNTGFTWSMGQYPSTFGTDRHGSVYYVVANNGVDSLWKRPIGGGAWMLDNNGLGGAQPWAFTAERDGTPVIGTLNSGLFRRGADGWSQMPSPPKATGSIVYSASVDSSGWLIAAFTGSGYVGAGVFATTDHGSTWMDLGFGRREITKLVSYQDTTYALGLRRVYAITHNDVVTTVRDLSGAVPRSTAIACYPNPLAKQSTIVFATQAAGHATVRISDALGRTVATLVDDILPAGTHSVAFNSVNLPAGEYFCTMATIPRSGVGQVETLKIIVRK